MSDRNRTATGEFAPEVPDEEILMVLRRNESHVMTATEIADEIGMTRQTVTRRLKRMYNDGLVGRKEVGARAVVWWLTDEGKMAGLSRRSGDENDREDPERVPAESHLNSTHKAAFETFARQATDAVGDEIHEIILFGSTARGETHGVDSDVDVFVVVESMDVKDTLDDIAYQAMHEHGVVVSLVIKTVDIIENNADHPFLKNVRREGHLYS